MSNELITTAKTPSLPRAVISALTHASEYVLGQGPRWTPRAAFQSLPEERRANLSTYVASAERSLAPAEASWIEDRLSTMQLAMTQGWSPAKATAWLHETRRLLADVPQDILDWALDEAVKGSVRGFLPSVGEIRAFVDPKMAERRRIASRLAALEKFDPQAKSKEEPVEYATPEQRAEIKAEFGLKTDEPTAKRPPATVADYIAMGVSEIEAHKAVADHARMQAHGAKPIGAAEPARKAARMKAPPEIGYGLISMALARRYSARRERDERRVHGLNQTLATFLATYDRPPFAALLALTRVKLREMRSDIAA